MRPPLTSFLASLPGAGTGPLGLPRTPAADHRGIPPDPAMIAHLVAAETRSRVLQNGGDHHQAGHSRSIRRVRRCVVSKQAARARIRSLSAIRSVSVVIWAR